MTCFLSIFNFREPQITTDQFVDRREGANATNILKDLLNENVYDIRTRPFAQSEFTFVYACDYSL